MTERNTWAVERLDLGVMVLLGRYGSRYVAHVVRYDFVPTRFPECQPFTVRFEHHRDATPESIELEECKAIGKAIRDRLVAR